MAKFRVAVIGCGVVGAMVAYELSQVTDLDILLLDKSLPAQGATCAALGVLMGVISQKVKGRNWRLRDTSIRRYHTLMPELEARLGRSLPFNHQGILSLCFDAEQIPRWQSLQTKRQEQGWPLEIWSSEQLVTRCPHINPAGVQAAIYSPQDAQVPPTELTLALVEAAQQQGTHCHWSTEVTHLRADQQGRCHQLETQDGPLAVDWVILTAGLGVTPLSVTSPEPVAMGPVLGQALELQLPGSLGDPHFQPAINGEDVHLVPLGNGRYWVGATVEFPPESDLQVGDELQPDAERLDQIWQVALGYCPALSKANILRTWAGLRPRPQAQPAPVIKPLAGFTNVIVAAGHYRNGILLAPATASVVKAMLLEQVGNFAH
jgi:glycine oxidase